MDRPRAMNREKMSHHRPKVNYLLLFQEWRFPLQGRWARAPPTCGQQIYSPRALCTGELDPRDLKTALFCTSFLRKGEVLAYVGLPPNLKDLKGWRGLTWEEDALIWDRSRVVYHRVYFSIRRHFFPIGGRCESGEDGLQPTSSESFTPVSRKMISPER